MVKDRDAWRAAGVTAWGRKQSDTAEQLNNNNKSVRWGVEGGDFWSPFQLKTKNSILPIYFSFLLSI